MSFKSTPPVRNVNLPALESGDWPTITFLSNSGLYGPTGEALTLECYRCQEAYSGSACSTYLREIETEGGDSFEYICTGCIRTQREETAHSGVLSKLARGREEEPTVARAGEAKQLAADILSLGLDLAVKKDEYLEVKQFSYSVSYVKTTHESAEDGSHSDNGYWLPGGWFHSTEDEESRKEIEENREDYQLAGSIDDLVYLFADRGIEPEGSLDDCLGERYPTFYSDPQVEDYSTGEEVTYSLAIRGWENLAAWVQIEIYNRVKQGR